MLVSLRGDQLWWPTSPGGRNFLLPIRETPICSMLFTFISEIHHNPSYDWTHPTSVCRNTEKKRTSSSPWPTSKSQRLPGILRAAKLLVTPKVFGQVLVAPKYIHGILINMYWNIEPSTVQSNVTWIVLNSYYPPTDDDSLVKPCKFQGGWFLQSRRILVPAGNSYKRLDRLHDPCRRIQLLYTSVRFIAHAELSNLLIKKLSSTSWPWSGLRRISPWQHGPVVDHRGPERKISCVLPDPDLWHRGLVTLQNICKICKCLSCIFRSRSQGFPKSSTLHSQSCIVSNSIFASCQCSLDVHWMFMKVMIADPNLKSSWKSLEDWPQICPF